jgi:hypothetical protein
MVSLSKWVLFFEDPLHDPGGGAQGRGFSVSTVLRYRPA